MTRCTSKRVLAVGLVACFSVSWLAACGSRVDASATCKSLQAFDSRLGTLNVPNFALGTIFVVDTKNHTATTLAVLEVPTSETIASPVVAKQSVGFESSLDVSFSGNVKQQVKIALTSYIQTSSKLSLTNVMRTTMKDVQAFVDQNQRAKALFRDAAGPNMVLFVVSAVQQADGMALALADGQHAGANASIMNVGDLELSVTYKCNAATEFTGKQFNAFFKAIPLAYDPTTDSIRFDSKPDVDFKEYRFVNALAQ